ncbi:FAD-dependent oxidoreductase [Sorangium cellulosum]|uniref:FAD-dependent oxidoreductase n=1 Tax=Sorangium cellulosum TaxID=56 RepID=UPI0009D70CF8
MPTIAIVGAGMAGLHLALHLQKEGLDVSLYEERAPDEIRAGRLPSTVALSPLTRERQRALGRPRRRPASSRATPDAGDPVAPPRHVARRAGEEHLAAPAHRGHLRGRVSARAKRRSSVSWSDTTSFCSRVEAITPSRSSLCSAQVAIR